MDGPWDWPPHARVRQVPPRNGAALTLSPAWGVSASAPSTGPLGRAGPWDREAADIERAYSPDRTVHVSLEEFARTLTAAQENRERFREGGVRARSIPERLAASRAAGEVGTLRDAYRRFRAFDRPNLVHLFATFAPHRSFHREFPEAVQTGPLWPRRYRHHRAATGDWVWYASPSSAEAIAPQVLVGLGDARKPAHLLVRTPHPWRVSLPRSVVRVVSEPIASRRWREKFQHAALRIVTGSRTLLEALEVGGPFLYFNGVLGTGPRRRRHRPEKLQALLATPVGRRMPADLRRDLMDFASGRRVRAIVRRAADREGGWSRFPETWSASRFPPGLGDAGAVLVAISRRLAAGERSVEIVASLRHANS